ncbi:MAG TPA: ATP-binding protein [Chloroflexota bacterium]|nr:ATP-binding protein [Chloroflexota bacterium]
MTSFIDDEVADELRRITGFDVADAGPGIPPGERERLFEAYFRAESTSRAAPRVGLGLAIVKANVDAHGGRAGVASAPRKGTRFWVELPAASGSLADGHSEADLAPEESGSARDHDACGAPTMKVRALARPPFGR